MEKYKDTPVAIAGESAAWSERSDDLANWVMERLVVRADAYGRYYTKGGVSDAKTERGKLDLDLLKRHFVSTSGSFLVGVHTTALDDTCRWLAIDLDQHEDEDDVTAALNQRFACHVVDELAELGFEPLLLDSNGVGGFHLFVLFTKCIPAQLARSFGRWLVREWVDFGLPGEPEVFPKQASIGGKFGNFVRLPGHHYERGIL